MKDTSRYTIDSDWLRGRGKRRPTGTATVRATVSNPDAGVAERQVETWLSTIADGSGDSRWRGGWAVDVRSRSAREVVLDLSSGGEDVADSLSDAVDDLQDAVLCDGTVIDWVPQPIARRRKS